MYDNLFVVEIEKTPSFCWYLFVFIFIPYLYLSAKLKYNISVIIYFLLIQIIILLPFDQKPYKKKKAYSQDNEI